MNNKLKPQQFKNGDWAWSPSYGWGKCEGDHTNGWLMHFGDTYYLSGNLGQRDKHPTLLSVENAALLGFYPPQEARKAREFWIHVSHELKVKPHISYCSTDVELNRLKNQMEIIHVREVLEDE